MTKREKLVVSAYTGVLMTEFDEFHQFVTDILGRAVYTHELADEAVMKKIKAAVTDEFLRICASDETGFVPSKETIRPKEVCRPSSLDIRSNVDILGHTDPFDRFRY